MSPIEPGQAAGAPAGHTISADAIQAQLERIVSSKAFEGARRTTDLLAHLMDAVLGGRARELREHAIAVRLFCPNPPFDPKAYSKLRSVARRLRYRLDDYYREEGAGDPILIELPRTSYVPVIRRNAPADADNAAAEFLGAAVETAETGEETAGEPSEAPAEAPRPGRQRLRPMARFERRSLWPLALGGVLLAAAGVLAGFYLLPALFDSGAAAPQFTSFRRLAADGGVSIDPSVTPDGRFLAFASDRGVKGPVHIWFQTLTQGDPTQVTAGEFDDYQPSLAPDGTRVAFRSERDGGGVFVVSTAGGLPKLIAAKGRNPRFSPDGQWIAYSVRTEKLGVAESSLHVVPSAGGTPRPITAGMASADQPVWNPDSNHILFTGRAPAGQNAAPRPADYWVTSLDGRTLVDTKIVAAFRAAAMQFGPAYTWLKEGNRVLLEAFHGESRNLWMVRLGNGFLPKGPPVRITAGAGSEASPVLLADGRLVFVNARVDHQIWSIPVDAAQGKAAGEPEPLTRRESPNEYAPALMRDGTRLGYMADRLGRFVAFVRPTAGGQETRLAPDGRAWSPVFSRDGNYTAYLVADPARRKVFAETAAAGGGTRRQACDSCERIIAVSAGGARVLYGARFSPADPMWIGVIDMVTGVNNTLLSYPDHVIFAADWSPDERFVVFSARSDDGRSQLRVSRIDNTRAQMAVAITEPSPYDDKPRFSPDGGMVYFLSDRDGRRCVWAQRVEPSLGRAIGQPFAVFHFHGARFTPAGVPLGRQEMSVARDRLAVGVQEVRSDIWLAETSFTLAR